MCKNDIFFIKLIENNMGVNNSIPVQGPVMGINTRNENVTLQQVLNKHLDLENIITYIRKFINRQMELEGRVTDYQAEIYYANSLVTLTKPYSPHDLRIPRFEEKPPSFEGNIQPISEHEYRSFILDCLEYFGNFLASIRLE